MDGIRSDDRHRHDAILADIARTAAASLELDQLLERIAQRAAELTGADRSSILLLDHDGTTLLPSALFGMDSAFTEGWKRRPVSLMDEPLSREAVQTQQPVVVVDAPTDPRTDKGSVAFFGDKSILVAPLVGRDAVLGTLFLNHVRRQYVFTPEDVATTRAIAGHAAVFIENARLYHDTRRLAEQLRTSFGYAGEALASTHDVQQILQMMLRLAVETVDAAGGQVELLDESGRSTYLAASVGRRRSADDEAGRYPLATAERPLGALTLWRKSPAFSTDERTLLTAFAGHARTAIEHARLYASLQGERERASQAEQARSEFTSMISHELRTPLALIQGYVSTLQRPGLKLAPDTSYRFLEGIRQASDRLRKLIDNLLTSSALEERVFPSDPKTLEVSGLVKRAIGEVAMLDQGRRIVLDGEETPVAVLGDADQLTQVLENLLSNAAKYAPGDTPIQVHLQHRDGRVVIAVRDGGPGIPAQALDLIFEKFYRVPVPRDTEPDGHTSFPPSLFPRVAASTRPGGMGLGLFICRRIVEAHGGRIWAENVPEGGAAFFVELPAVLRGLGHSTDRLKEELT